MAKSTLVKWGKRSRIFDLSLVCRLNIDLPYPVHFASTYVVILTEMRGVYRTLAKPVFNLGTNEGHKIEPL